MILLLYHYDKIANSLQIGEKTEHNETHSHQEDDWFVQPCENNRHCIEYVCNLYSILLTAPKADALASSISALEFFFLTESEKKTMNIQLTDMESIIMQGCWLKYLILAELASWEFLIAMLFEMSPSEVYQIFNVKIACSTRCMSEVY